MHRLNASFVLGYHGCDESVADRLLRGENFKSSQNTYDWLGHGIYFWEANPKRGFKWAESLARKQKSKIQNPSVVGAIIDLRRCLDMTTKSGIDQIKQAYSTLSKSVEEADTKLPDNGTDLMARHLDCAVIMTLHDIRNVEGLEAIDTVKGVFVEGAEAYPNSGFMKETHIQICVCNPECIRGVFRVPRSDLR